MAFCAFDGLYWEKMQVDNQVTFTYRKRQRTRTKESIREKLSVRDLTEWEWHKGTGGRSKQSSEN